MCPKKMECWCADFASLQTSLLRRPPGLRAPNNDLCCCCCKGPSVLHVPGVMLGCASARSLMFLMPSNISCKCGGSCCCGPASTWAARTASDITQVSITTRLLVQALGTQVGLTQQQQGSCCCFLAVMCASTYPTAFASGPLQPEICPREAAHNTSAGECVATAFNRPMIWSHLGRPVYTMQRFSAQARHISGQSTPLLMQELLAFAMTKQRVTGNCQAGSG